MAKKPATKKGTEKVTDTNTAPAEIPAVDPTPATEPAVVATDAAPVEGVAWGANPELNKDLLARIVAATQGNSFVYANEADYTPLVAAGYAEVNPGMVDDNGNVATRATTKGIAFMSDTDTNTAGEPAPNTGATDPVATQPAATAATDTTGTQPAATDPAAPAARTVSAIMSVPLPEKKRASSGGRTSEYEFDKLEVGQSFFVAKTAKMPNPKKSLASTVSSATRRFATAKLNPDGTPVTRKMKIAGVEKDVPTFTNTRVFELFAGTGDAYGMAGVEGAIVARTS